MAVGRYKTCGTPCAPRGGNKQRPATNKDAHSLCVATCYGTDLIKKIKKKKKKKRHMSFSYSWSLIFIKKDILQEGASKKKSKY